MSRQEDHVESPWSPCAIAARSPADKARREAESVVEALDNVPEFTVRRNTLRADGLQYEVVIYKDSDLVEVGYYATMAEAYSAEFNFTRQATTDLVVKALKDFRGKRS